MAVARSAPASSVASAMRASPYLRRLAPRHHKLLVAAATRRTLDPGEQLETTTAEPRLYLVLTGEIGAWAADGADGVAELVGREGPGAMFGSAPLTGETEPAAFRATSAAEVCAWSDDDLRGAFARADDLERRLAVALSLRARHDEIVALLRRTPLFAHVSQVLIRRLVASSTLDAFAASSVICRKGDEGSEMFLVIAGEVAIGHDPQGTLARLHRDDFFGEIALVRRAPRMSTATTLCDVELLVVGDDAFAALDERSPAFARAVRLTAQRRIEVGVDARREPELVWLVNHEPRCRGDKLAALLAQALADDDAQVAAPEALRTSGALRATLDAARERDVDYVLAWSDGPVPDRLAREVAARASSVVAVEGDEIGASPAGPFACVHHVVVTEPDGALAAQPLRRDAIVLRARPRDLERRRLERLPDEAQRGLRRIARAVSRRRVGVALGGGAAWGYAHVALIRALEAARIPIDMVVGVSMGAMVGAFYASQGLAGLDRLVDASVEITGAAIGSVATTQSVSMFVRRHIPEARIEELGLPLATVAVDARTARERVFRHGSVSGAVRASCSLPGVFAPSVLGGRRYLDGAVRNNVPASVCLDAGADFVVACDVVPLPGVARGTHRRGLTGLVLDVTRVNRVSDAVRSLYWLASDNGRHQASVADVVFSPDLAEYEPWDFPRARSIVRRAEEQLEAWLPATVARYEALARAGRAHG